ncbi:hypothetical protein CDL12_00134, partial [Handroanthus impetiginosus]
LVWDDGSTVTQLELSSKDVRSSVAERLIITDVKFRAEQSEKSTLDLGTNIVQLDNHMSSATKEDENIKGNFKKRADRLTLESPEETMNSKDNNTMDDIAAMDYAQPHRKPPIHNKGT